MILMPVLLSKIKSESADIRFLSLKIFTDIITSYLSDETIYNAKSLEDDSNPTTKNFTKLINELIVKNLFRIFPLILQDGDPVPANG